MPDLDLGHTRLIISDAMDAGLTVPQTAYVLATAFWETNRTMQPVEEAYYLGSRAEAYRRRLRYYPWHGRGFVQLTWESNYIRAGAALGVDLISDPDRAMEPAISARVLVIGSRDGWFTGRRLSHYITASGSDYINARRIINGSDCAAQIAAIADDYLHALTPAPDYPMVRRGMRGAAVAQAQSLLSANGYPPGALDGIFGTRTDLAARAFQRSAGLAADGVIGPATWAALTPDLED